MRRINIAMVTAESLNVAVTKVIGKDKDDVRCFRILVVIRRYKLRQEQVERDEETGDRW